MSTPRGVQSVLRQYLQDKRLIAARRSAENLLMYGNTWTVLELPEMPRPLGVQLALLIDHEPAYTYALCTHQRVTGDLRESFKSMGRLYTRLFGTDEQGRPCSETVAVPSDGTPVVAKHRYRTL